MADRPSELTDEILVAFADGELSGSEQERLKPLIEADSEARARLDELQAANTLIKRLFDVDVPEETPTEVAERIRLLARASQDDASGGNVVSLSSYRQKMTASIRNISSGHGWQKIAASLIVGGFVGFGVAPQYLTEGPGDTDGYQVASVPDENSTIVLRGIQKEGSSQSFDQSENLYLFNDQREYFNGEQVDFSKNYRIKIILPEEGQVSVTYREPSGASELIIDNKSIVKGTFLFPEKDQEGIKITTKEEYILFDVSIQYSNRKIRKMFTFSSLN